MQTPDATHSTGQAPRFIREPARGACCEVLAWLDVVAGSDPLPAGGSYGSTTAARLASDAQPLSLPGAKTWLSACSPALEDAPADLDALRARFGAYDEPSFRSELHPASLAKQAGRRIFRSADGDDALVVAESRDADCSARATTGRSRSGPSMPTAAVSPTPTFPRAKGTMR